MIVFDVTQFRIDFPYFANVTTFQDVTLQGYWDIATLYVSDEDYGYLTGRYRERAINLMTAHMGYISMQANKGKQGKIVQSSSIDKISVSLVPPNVKSDFSFWLNQSPYGVQLLALLSAVSVGGWYVQATNINARGMR